MQLAQSAYPRIDSVTQDADDSDTQGSAPEPTEVLSTRRLTLKSSKTTFPPALGRSPYKTNIGSSPRRQSSVKLRRQTETPELLEPRPTVTRRLEFGASDGVEKVSSLRKPAKRKSAAAQKQDVYALEATEEEDNARYNDEEDDLPVLDESLQLLPDDGYDGAPALDEPSEPDQISSPTRKRASRASQSHITHDDTSLAPAPSAKSKKSRPATRRSLAEEEEEEPARAVRAPQRTAQGRGGKATLRSTKQVAAPIEESVISLEDSAIEPSFTEPRSRPAPKGKGKGKGRSRQLPTPEDTQPTADDPIETTELDDSVVEPAAKGRGAKAAGKRKMTVYDDSEIPDPEERTELVPRPAKRAKAAPKKTAAAKTAKGKNKEPRERDPNIMAPPSPAFKKPALPTAPKGSGARWDESMWASSRSMSRLRDPTPSAEAMVGRTRSGRQVIKPLNHFANERAQYGRDGTLLAVQTAETVAAPARARSRAPSKAPGRAASRRRPMLDETIIEEDEQGEDEELEDWEARGELIYGEVNGYDALTGQTLEEQFETGEFRRLFNNNCTGCPQANANLSVLTELAWSASSIPLMPVSSANFGFAKLLSMPFFGSGIMDFPVGGFKKPRNSGKTSLHIFVHTGKVWVRVGGVKTGGGNMFMRNRGTDGVEGGNEFVVSRGGSFHVPRGECFLFICLFVSLFCSALLGCCVHFTWRFWCGLLSRSGLQDPSQQP